MVKAFPKKEQEPLAEAPRALRRTRKVLREKPEALQTLRQQEKLGLRRPQIPTSPTGERAAFLSLDGLPDRGNPPPSSSYSLFSAMTWEINLDQLTTPIDLIVAPQETITVVDPRHPLFGRTLPCVGISNSCHRGRCCIAWIRRTVERHVPVGATYLEYDPSTLYPLPMSLASLQQ